MENDFIIIIPARFKSSRFPGKPLADIKGKSMIYRVWEKCIEAADPKKVFIATDDQRIENHCLEKGMNVLMTSEECLTGTDRMAEVSETIKADFYVNVQGDEPLINPLDISKVISSYKSQPEMTHCAMTKISSEEEFRSTNVPKVVVDHNKNLLYMSRSGIPANKEDTFSISMKQVCIYAFPKEHLSKYGQDKPKTPMENIEDIEILRLIENGLPVKMVELSNSSIAVDTPEDLQRVASLVNDKL